MTRSIAVRMALILAVCSSTFQRTLDGGVEAGVAMSGALTALESEVVRMTAAEHWPAFRLDGLRVVRRENTGAGRFVYLEDAWGQTVPDGTHGTHGAQGRMIEMDGVRYGLGFVVAASNSRISHIEIFTYGNERWDGVERPWKVI